MPLPIRLDDVLAMYREHGHRLYGEDVSELEHALQCAMLAERAGEPLVVVAAALLHDYGHLCHALGEDIAEHGVDAQHEQLGYTQLKVLFTDEIVEAGRLHVVAKRYLCWKEPAYLANLSDSSRRSLALQGGPMREAEAYEFEAEPCFDLAVRVRRYDDLAKEPGMLTPTLEHYRPVLRRFLRDVTEAEMSGTAEGSAPLDENTNSA